MSAKKFFAVLPLLGLVAILALALPDLHGSASAYSGFPTFDIASVKSGESVSITTNNLPPNDTFTVTMGAMGTRGVGGVVVASTPSGSGGTQSFTYNIPDSLKSAAQIAIRMQSPTSGYFAYNWFTNVTSTTSGGTSGGTSGSTSGGTSGSTSGYSGFPTFSISSVTPDQSVTVQTSNLPANDSFTVTMGAFGTKGVGGTVVATTPSGSGGSQTFTYDIPAALKGSALIAIRMQSSTSGYFAYNWFHNTTSSSSSGSTGGTSGSTGGTTSGYTGFPTFSISSVVKDTSVTIQTSNLPANDSFTVTMGAFGTQGVGGTVVTTTDSGSGGSQTFTYTIPSSLQGSSRIAIRLQSATSGFFAYNWFWNN
jgi:hypothetical protein